MNYEPSILARLQDEVVKRLQGDEYLSDIEVVGEDKKDLLQTVELQLKKLGIVIIVADSEANCTKPGLPGPVFDSIKFSVIVSENTMFNRAASGTGKVAKEVAVRISQRLHQFRPASSGMTICIDNPSIKRIDDSQYLIFEVNFKLGE